MTSLWKIISLLFIINSSLAHSQIKAELLDSLISKIDDLLNDDWFIEPSKHGFKVYFCRSCQENYEDYLKTIDWFQEKWRYDFFQPEIADSVSYFSTVSRLTAPDDPELRHKHLLKEYNANGILSFEISLEKKWSQASIDNVLEKNELLKQEILREPLYKSNERIFSDYRFWLPEKFWQKRTAKYDFYFERLPYASTIVENSIFIIPDKPFYFAGVIYVDKDDEKFYKTRANFLDDEREKALHIIALVLGIHDYKIVN